MDPEETLNTEKTGQQWKNIVIGVPTLWQLSETDLLIKRPVLESSVDEESKELHHKVLCRGMRPWCCRAVNALTLPPQTYTRIGTHILSMDDDVEVWRFKMHNHVLSRCTPMYKRCEDLYLCEPLSPQSSPEATS